MITTRAPDGANYGQKIFENSFKSSIWNPATPKVAQNSFSRTISKPCFTLLPESFAVAAWVPTVV